MIGAGGAVRGTGIQAARDAQRLRPVHARVPNAHAFGVIDEKYHPAGKGEDPAHDQARLEIAKLLLRHDPAAARTQLESIAEDAGSYTTAQHLLHLVGVVEESHRRPAPTNGAAPDSDTLLLYRAAATDFAHGDWNAALEKWIEVVGRDRTLDDDGARRACIAAFAVLGEHHELTQTWRRRFSMALSV